MVRGHTVHAYVQHPRAFTPRRKSEKITINGERIYCIFTFTRTQFTEQNARHPISRRKPSRRRYEIVNEIAPSVRVQSASESRLSGVSGCRQKSRAKLPPRQPSSTRRGSVQQRSSGWQHSGSACVHSVMSDSLSVHVICSVRLSVSAVAVCVDA